MAKAPESAPLLGIGTGGKTVAVDLNVESPHILVNASTGGGKSVTLRCITCQMLHHGSQAFILDYKRISHPWARGIPGVTCTGGGSTTVLRTLTAQFQGAHALVLDAARLSHLWAKELPTVTRAGSSSLAPGSKFPVWEREPLGDLGGPW
ncbi:helicase HerA domain-containing protein [Streptomyces sp. NPDC050164]|uniref:helicase HerA domain-containing protein n=1 Tax=Streptomyces sp. NPDC050164 TaxID=3365605 RepID=UPI0037B3A886